MQWLARVIIFVVLSRTVFASEILQENALNLRPTQPTVGMASVNLKAEKFDKMKKKEREEYLRLHPIPVVIGPGHEYYLIDHHHMSRALLKAKHEKLYIQVIADWSSMLEADFWRQMEASGYTYLYNADQKKVDPSELPKSIKDLNDDPYRSLAYFAREAGAFEKSTTPFAEFGWAAFYKKYISLEELHDWKKATLKAVEISKSAEASKLPGYKAVIYCPGVF